MRDGVQKPTLLFLIAFACGIFSSPLLGQTVSDTNWPYYGGGAGGMRYSPLTQINPGNVSKLKVAWLFHTGDVSDGKHGSQRSGFEATAILVDGMLFFTAGFSAEGLFWCTLGALWRANWDDSVQVTAC